MAWDLLHTDEFQAWWDSLDDDEQDSLLVSIELLKNLGPGLPRPYADTVKDSKHSNMKELRTQHKGRPFRTFFAFDSKRRAILLVGGDKTGSKRFYKKMIKKADELFDRHLASLKREK